MDKADIVFEKVAMNPFKRMKDMKQLKRMTSLWAQGKAPAGAETIIRNKFHQMRSAGTFRAKDFGFASEDHFRRFLAKPNKAMVGERINKKKKILAAI